MIFRLGKRPFVPAQGTRWLVVLLLLALFALYTHQLDGQSIWRDEALSIGRARQPISQIFRNQNILENVVSPDLHPPFYFLMLSGWRRLAGESEFAYRYPSVLTGLLLIPLFVAVGRRIWGSPTGQWAALLAGLSPFYFWYAQEARMYSLLAVESLLLLWCMWPLLHAGAKVRHYLHFGAAALLTFYTHYTAVFLIGFAVLAILLHRLQRRTILYLAAAGVAAALIAVPLFPHLQRLLSAEAFFAFSRRPPLAMLTESVNTFSLGSTIPMPDAGWRMWLLGAAALIGSLSAGTTPEKRRYALTIGIGGFVVILSLFYAAAWLQANYSNPRHLTILSVFWFLLLGHGVATLQRLSRPLAALLAAALFWMMAAATWTAVATPPIVRDDVRAVINYIQERAQPGDIVLWHDAPMMVAFDYYAAQTGLATPYRALPAFGQGEVETVLETARSLMEQHARIWFVHQPTPNYFDNRELVNLFAGQWIHAASQSFVASWSPLGLHLYHPAQSWETLPAAALPLSLEHASYRAHGVQLELDASAAGTWANVYWQTTGETLSRSPHFCLYLRDGEDVPWTQACQHVTPPPTLPPSRQFVQQVWLPLPQGLTPTPHRVEMVMEGKPETAGTLRPAPTAAAEAEQMPQARFANGLTLLDMSLNDREFRSGLWFAGNLLWQVDRPVTAQTIIEYRLVDVFGRVIANDREVLGSDDYPAAAWQPGTLVRTEFALRLPYHKTGNYRLQVALHSQEEAAPSSWKWRTAGWGTVVGWPFQAEVPPQATVPANAVRLADGAIELAGYEVAREDATVTVILYWYTRRKLDAAYGIFVHVGRLNEPPLAQDSFIDFLRPVASWRRGEIIKTEHVIALPAEIEPAANLGINVGMYQVAEPGLRVPLTVDGEPAETSSWQIAPLPPK